MIAMSPALRQRSARRLFLDPAIRESLLASLLILVLSAGLSLLLSWLWVLRWALVRNRQPEQGVLLLCGHQLEAGRPSRDYRRRLARAASLMAGSPDLRLVLLGGGVPSEAAAGRDWLLANTRLEAGRIELEEDSIDSLENLRNARSLLPSNAALYLLSSRYHLGRLRLFAGQLGLPAELVAAEPGFDLVWRNLALTWQEAAYVCWFVSGRFWARLARRERLLERIR
jgi:uncharacterized SAM-binding protein YcdF (DUF218 family)